MASRSTPPDHREPLYPPVLSQGAASLLPGEVRPAIIFDLDLGSGSELQPWSVESAAVQSREQFTFAQLLAHAEQGGTPETREQPVQGNLLVGPEVLQAVARSFEATERSGRHLADRLIEALAAGQAAGGDARKGRVQSLAVVVADPRPGRSRRPDQVTADINVCEHPEPVAELRRIYDTISETLGHRTLQQYAGADVWQLKLMLHALGYFRPEKTDLVRDETANVYTEEAVAAVDAFRRAEGLTGPDVGSPPGLVDSDTIARLWSALEQAGKADAVRQRIREITAVRR